MKSNRMSCDLNSSGNPASIHAMHESCRFFHTICYYIISCTVVQAICCKLFFSVSANRKKMKKESLVLSLINFSQGCKLYFYLLPKKQETVQKTGCILKRETVDKIIHHKAVSDICYLFPNPLHSQMFIDSNGLLIVAVYCQPNAAASLHQCFFLNKSKNL